VTDIITQRSALITIILFAGFKTGEGEVTGGRKPAQVMWRPFPWTDQEGMKSVHDLSFLQGCE